LRNFALHKIFAFFLKRSIAIGLLSLCFIATVDLHAQTPTKEYQVKAVFLFNFSQFVNWPPAAFSSSNAPFIIGIVGHDPFGSYINETVAGEKMMGHPIKVLRCENKEDIKECHILFIAHDQSIEDIVSSLDNRSILTVSDEADFTRHGGMIRFFTENNKIRLEINISAVKAAKLNISSKLLRVAQIVE
jgi:hypothetical protein